MLKMIKTKQLLYLEIHDEKDGQKIFRCSTRYDWYVLKNIEYSVSVSIHIRNFDFGKKSNNSPSLKVCQVI
jgi:hypothetical protein